MSDYFTSIIRAGGFTNDRHVLYSLKDSLIDRLQRQGASDDAMRGIIGHVSGQGKLRHYKTPFGQSPHGMKAPVLASVGASVLPISTRSGTCPLVIAVVIFVV